VHGQETNRIDRQLVQLRRVNRSSVCWVHPSFLLELICVVALFPFSQLGNGVRRETQHQYQIFGSRSKYSSSSFVPPSPRPRVFSDSMNSIRSIHLTILYPSWFSTRSRSGAPYSSVSGAPFISEASKHSGFRTFSKLCV